MKEQEESNGTDLNKLIATGDFSVLGKPGEMLIQANKDLVKAPEAYSKLLEMLNDPAHAKLVQHCTAGKDRAGLGSAILLLTLGVPEKTVIKDEQALESFKALLDVRPEYVQAAFDTMKEEFGSIDAFIEKGLGVTPQERAALQAKYLE